MYTKKSFLRNVAKILVASLVAVTFFTGCKKDDPPKPAKTVVITGIPEMYVGKVAALSVVDKNVLVMKNISGSSTTFRLLDSKTDEPWRGEGHFKLVFLIYENTQAMSEGKPLWSGHLSGVNITEETTTVGWDEFLEIIL